MGLAARVVGTSSDHARSLGIEALSSRDDWTADSGL